MEKAIQIEKLCYSYDSSHNVIEDINLCIEDNEFTAIIGRNGSGKTTLLKNITGLLRPSSGAVFIRGKNSRDMTVAAISTEIGFVTQNPDRQLFAATVYDEIVFALKNAKIAENEIIRRVENALAVTGLSGLRGTYPPALNRGERAKTVIASVLAMEPRTVIFDEPSAGQDYRGTEMIMDIAAGLHRKGHTVIFVTHNMSLAARYARRIVVMDNKKITAAANAEDLFYGDSKSLHVVPPRITRLSRELREHLPLEKDALTVESLADMLLSLKARRKLA